MGPILVTPQSNLVCLKGSVLGPLLFLIYINGLERNIKSNIKLFAVDTMLFSIVKDPAISANNLNYDHQTTMGLSMENGV